jgi:hypothetical protein
MVVVSVVIAGLFILHEGVSIMSSSLYGDRSFGWDKEDLTSQTPKRGSGRRLWELRLRCFYSYSS